MPSKCFSPKASRLREKQRYNLTSQTFLQKSSPNSSCFTSAFYTFRHLQSTEYFKSKHIGISGVGKTLHHSRSTVNKLALKFTVQTSLVSSWDNSTEECKVNGTLSKPRRLGQEMPCSDQPGSMEQPFIKRTRAVMQLAGLNSSTPSLVSNIT